MVDFILFVFATIGLTFIITKYYIFKWLRDYVQSRNKFLGKLIHCPACMGWYCGVFVQFLFIIKDRSGVVLYWPDLFYVIYGFMGSFFSYVSFLLLKPLMDKYD